MERAAFPQALRCALSAAIVTTSRSEPNVLIKTCPVGRDTFFNQSLTPPPPTGRDTLFSRKIPGEIAPHPDSPVFDPEAQTQRELAEVQRTGRGEKVVVTVMVNYFQ